MVNKIKSESMAISKIVLAAVIIVTFVVGAAVGIFAAPFILFHGHMGFPQGGTGSLGSTNASNDNLTGTLNLSAQGVGHYNITLYVYNPPVWNFSASNIVVAAGSVLTVTFKNTGDEDHTFTINNPNGSGYLVDSGYVAPGQNKTVTFTVPSASGNYTYYCRVPGHKEDGMVGTLEVT